MLHNVRWCILFSAKLFVQTVSRFAIKCDLKKEAVTQAEEDFLQVKAFCGLAIFLKVSDCIPGGKERNVCRKLAKYFAGILPSGNQSEKISLFPLRNLTELSRLLADRLK